MQPCRQNKSNTLARVSRESERLNKQAAKQTRWLNQRKARATQAARVAACAADGCTSSVRRLGTDLTQTTGNEAEGRSCRYASKSAGQ